MASVGAAKGPPMSRLAPVIAAALAALLGWGTVHAFADRFADGATWSGLNPDGGGPGFVLLLAAALCSLAARPAWVRRLAPVPAVVESVASTIACAAAAALLFSSAPPYAGIDVTPFVSSIAGAFFVPRVVAAVLEHAWSHAGEGDVVPGGRASS